MCSTCRPQNQQIALWRSRVTGWLNKLGYFEPTASEILHFYRRVVAQNRRDLESFTRNCAHYCGKGGALGFVAFVRDVADNNVRFVQCENRRAAKRSGAAR